MLSLFGTGLALLPLAAFGGLWLRLRDRGNRDGFLRSAILCGVLIVLATEILSSFSAITRLNVAMIWCLATCLAWAWGVSGNHVKADLSAQERTKDIGFDEKILLGFAALIVLTLGSIALIAPPNTWDAMQYNMPRIVMWMENHSVRLYPTIDYQQLTMSPWSEYAMMHLILLKSSDRFAPLVEWFSFVGIVIGVSLISRELGADRKTQIVAAALSMTVPSAILFATSTKPDGVVAFWIVTSVYFLLRWKAAPALETAVFAAGAVGLAILSKGTAYLLLPGMFVFLVWMWPRSLQRRALAYAPLGILLILALGAPQFDRNFHISGSPLGFKSPDGDLDTTGQRHFQTGKFGPREILANSLRNIALHLETPSDRMNAQTESVFRRLIRGLGKDPDDPEMLEGGDNGGHENFSVERISLLEVRAGNMFHLFLIIFALGLLFMIPAAKRRDPILLLSGVVLSFFVVSAELRFQPSNARFYMPLFLIACPVLASVFAAKCPRWIILSICSLAILQAIPYVFSNGLRPLIPMHPGAGSNPSILRVSRDQLYFDDGHAYLRSSYRRAADFVAASGCREVGLDATLEHYEYPLLALAKAGFGGANFHYVGIINRSAAYAGSEPPPCAVVCLGCALVHQKWIQYQGGNAQVQAFDRVLVLLRKPSSLENFYKAKLVSFSTGSPEFPSTSSLCDFDPALDVKAILGATFVSAQSEKGCVYRTQNSRLEIDEMKSMQQAGTMPIFVLSEGIASVPFLDKKGFGAIVRDQNRPMVMYLVRPDRTLSVNLDRETPASESDYLHIAEILEGSPTTVE